MTYNINGRNTKTLNTKGDSLPEVRGYIQKVIRYQKCEATYKRCFATLMRHIKSKCFATLMRHMKSKCFATLMRICKRRTLLETAENGMYFSQLKLSQK